MLWNGARECTEEWMGRRGDEGRTVMEKGMAYTQIEKGTSNIS